MITMQFDINEYTNGANTSYPLIPKFTQTSAFVGNITKLNKDLHPDTDLKGVATSAMQVGIEEHQIQAINQWRIFDMSVLPFQGLYNTWTEYDSFIDYGRMNQVSHNCEFTQINNFTDGVNYNCLELSNYPAFQFTFKQSNKITTVQYTVQTVDLMLGVIGGFAALVWSTAGVIIGSYQEFRMETSLLQYFYTTDPNVTDEAISGKVNDLDSD